MSVLDLSFGPTARDRLAEATDPGRTGVLAALESFYYALNQRDLAVLAAVWADDPAAQLNNPLGGILRGGNEIVALYRRIFDSPARIEVTFGDILEYSGDSHAVFAGRETGTFTAADGHRVPLAIRTTRYFRFEPHGDSRTGRWSQWHHHGSIDDPDALRAYQAAVAGR